MRKPWRKRKEEAKTNLEEAKLYLSDLETNGDKSDSDYERKLRLAREEVSLRERVYRSYDGDAPARPRKTGRYAPDCD